MRALSSGVTLAKITILGITFFSSPSESFSNSSPVKTAFCGTFIPSSFATWSAVPLWSPVAITVLKPASAISSTTAPTPSLTGSFSAIRPRNSLSTARPSTRNPSYANLSMAFISSSVFSLVVCDFLRSTSGAPRYTHVSLESIFAWTAPNLSVELNGRLSRTSTSLIMSEINNLYSAPALTIAASSGRPIIFHSDGSLEGFSTAASITSIANLRIFSLCSWSIIFASSIRASVSVPVLSVSIRVVLPSASAATSSFTTPFCLASLSTPIARTTVSAIGNPSGTAETATATDIRNISKTENSRNIPKTKSSAAINKKTTPAHIEKFLMYFCSGVGSSPFSLTSDAILPNYVYVPVPVTTASPIPLVTRVPL